MADVSFGVLLTVRLQPQELNIRTVSSSALNGSGIVILTMHPIWQIPELLCQIISFLPDDDIARSFNISHYFRATLKANLAPQLCVLPDFSHTKTTRNIQPVLHGVLNEARSCIAHEVTSPKQMRHEHAYYDWREHACCQVPCALPTRLHPALAKHKTSLVNEYDSLTKGDMNVSLQIGIRHHDLHSLLHGEGTPGRDDPLAVVPPKSVTVFCLKGANWDLLYANVKYRMYGGVKRFSVRVEREGGVRLSDVLDELKGTLIVNRGSGALEQGVVLLWVFNGSFGKWT